MQEGPDVVVPGEGPERLHHFGHVLLSAGQREGGRRVHSVQPGAPQAVGWMLGPSSAPRRTPRARGTYQRSMVEPLVLRPRGYSSRQTNTPAALPLQSRSHRPGREGGWLSGAEGSRSIQPLGWGAPTPPTPARQAPGAGRGSAASLLGAPAASPTRLRSRHRASVGQQPLPSPPPAPPPPGRSSGRIHGVGAQVPLRELAGRGHDAPCHEDCEQKRSISGCPAAAWPPPEGTAAGVGAGSLAAPSGGGSRGPLRARGGGSAVTWSL